MGGAGRGAGADRRYRGSAGSGTDDAASVGSGGSNAKAGGRAAGRADAGERRVARGTASAARPGRIRRGDLVCEGSVLAADKSAAPRAELATYFSARSITNFTSGGTSAFVAERVCLT